MSDRLTWRHLPLADADVRLARLFSLAEAQAWFEQLRTQIPWERHRLRLFGRELPAPRLSCWVGDPGAVYTYSRTRFEPRPWTDGLAQLRERMRRVCAAPFNAVLCNLYRDGRDAMGWHSDDEPELGPEPVVASLSVGAVRRFRLRHRHDPAQRLELDLQPGSVLFMGGATQANYRHDLPRTSRPVGARINLTFRCIFVSETRERMA